jgi:glutaminyl-peptide cyclotransferase
MRKRWAALQVWARGRWLELLLVLGFVGILTWFGGLGYSFLPKPAPTPTPTPSPAPIIPTATAVPTRTPVPTPTATVMPVTGGFAGVEAYQYVLTQLKLGPRPAGSEADLKLGDTIAAELRKSGWKVTFQDFAYQGVKARNVIGKAGLGPPAIIGAHLDTRKRADMDPDPAKRNDPVPGANDGASGVAVLLELARTLDKSKLTNEVWLTFFDAEDNGDLDGWDWSAGSIYFVDHLTTQPQFMVLADMVGDSQQNIYKEQTSTKELVDRIWLIAGRLGYADSFKPAYKWSMTDDHTPFLAKGIPAVDLIDFDYPYWHTTQDTADKVAPASLERVGRVLQALLEGTSLP